MIDTLIKIRNYSGIVLACFIAVYFYFTCNKKKDTIVIDAPQSDVKYWKDKNDELHATVEAVKLEKKQLKHEVDSITNLIKIKQRQITGFSKTSNEIVVSVQPHITDTFFVQKECKGDSVKVAEGYSFAWKDEWMDISGKIGTGNDSIYIAGTDTISKTEYWKRSWFLGAKKNYIDIHNSNKHIKTKGYSGVQFIGRNKPYSVGIGVQVGYPVNQPIDFKKPTVSVGIAIQKTLFRF